MRPAKPTLCEPIAVIAPVNGAVAVGEERQGDAAVGERVAVCVTDRRRRRWCRRAVVEHRSVVPEDWRTAARRRTRR